MFYIKRMTKTKAFELSNTKNDNQLAKLTGYTRQYVGTWKNSIPADAELKVLRAAGILPSNLDDKKVS